MDITTITDLIAPIATVLGAAAPAAVWAGRRIATMSRTITALQGAVELHDAQNRGVVLTLSRATHPRSAIPLLRQAGWTVCPYDVSDVRIGADSDVCMILPTTDQFWADLAVADVVLVQGYSAADVATLASTERFRHTLGPGAAVVLFTPDSRSIFYDQRAWGDGDQSVTVPATAEAAVRSAVARRRHIQALQGVRPGGLDDARKALVG
jgi:hypothetical protein